MIRIARIKFSTSDEIYEYTLNDKSITEGDVVYLEDRKNPAFIYEIKEVKDNECKTLKKVVSKAIPNDCVTLSYKYMDITKSKSECIVNSLGTHVKVMGNICHAIYETARSKELEDYINKNSIGNVFDIIVTSAGKLPSKHIINIVMPYKYEDTNNELLRKAFSLVIDKAIELKYKSIAIPYIGTGANGYDYDDIHEALNDVMFNYQYKQGIEIDIISVRYHSLNKKRNVRDEEMIKERRLRGGYSTSFCIKNDYTIDNVGKIQDVIRRNYNKYDELKVDVLCSPADFIRAAIKKCGGYSKVPRMNVILNNNSRKNIASFKKNIKKEEIYSTAVVLKLNFTQIIQYMEISGYTFSPSTKDNLDINIFNYIVNNDGFTKSDDDITDYFASLSSKAAMAILTYEPPKRTKKKSK